MKEQILIGAYVRNNMYKALAMALGICTREGEASARAEKKVTSKTEKVKDK